MKRLLLTLCLTTALHAQQPAAAPHTFTSTDGRKLTATIIEKTATTVTLRRAEDGQDFILPLDRLSAADQTFVKAWGAELPPTPAAKPAKGSKKEEGAPKQLPQTTDTALLLKTESLGGVSFRLPEADLKKLLGEPDKWGEEGKDVRNGGTLIEADYSSKGLVIQLRTDEKSGVRIVDEVFAEASSTQRTTGGIQIGSTLEDLRRVYGAYEVKTASTESFFAAGSEREGIYFGLKEGRVFYIRLGAGIE